MNFKNQVQLVSKLDSRKKHFEVEGMIVKVNRANLYSIWPIHTNSQLSYPKTKVDPSDPIH